MKKCWKNGYGSRVISQKEVRKYVEKWKEIARVQAEFEEYRASMISKFQDGYTCEPGDVVLDFKQYEAKSTKYAEVISKVKDYLGDKVDMGHGWAEKLLVKLDRWVDAFTTESTRTMLNPKQMVEVRQVKSVRMSR